MCSISNLLRLCILLKLINGFNSYVLLAADADDFHNIAKKIAPEKLANKLAKLAFDTAMKRKGRGKSKQSDYYDASQTEDDYYSNEDEDVDEEDEATDTNIEEPSLYVREWNTRVNFDELVERVKDRLAKELTEKLKQHILNPPEESETQNIYNNVDKKDLQNNNLKNTASEMTTFGYKQNNFETRKSYGYNSISKSTGNIKNNDKTPNYFGTEYKGTEKKSFQQKEFENKYKSNDNNEDNYQGFKVNEEKYEIDGPNNFETPNKELVDYSNEKGKEKLSYDFIHEEDNDSYHGQINKDLIVETTEMNHNKQQIKHNTYSKIQEGDNKYKTSKIKPMRYSYEDTYSQESKAEENIFTGVDNSEKQQFFDKVDLISNKKNDSYEDYVIPKVDDKYASEETTKPFNLNQPRMSKKSPIDKTIKSQINVRENNKFKKTKQLKSERQEVDNEENTYVADNYRDSTDKSIEIKAKTESMLYNYDDFKPKPTVDDRSKKVNIPFQGSSKKYRNKGTMIPTREYFKMASPNYYISQPTVVEEYDPNEPLPEKDRKKEVIKHIGNPPASINKKVKLT